ncbi:MAG: methyltransferase domain-containing protein [Flavobacteriales bacterium]|nr:methyltransferase domain-containing protein [Flavobacteriales bacterium]
MNDQVRFNQAYWDNRYSQGDTGWDIGYASPAILEFCRQYVRHDAKILIPGCGNAWEGLALTEAGYEQVYLLDISALALDQVRKRFASFPSSHLIHEDFFAHQGSYDIILEQTFFCAIDRTLRSSYVKQARRLLKPGGRLAGLLFANEFDREGPPFGGTEAEYRTLFEPHFNLDRLELATNSIPPRAGNELFILATRK